MLGSMADHLQAADDKNVEARVATLADDFRYIIWADGENIGASSKAEAENYYRRLVSSHAAPAQLTLDHFLVASDRVVAEGLERLTYSGEFAMANGAPEALPGEVWVSEFRICTIWAFDAADHRISSITAYVSPPPTIRRRWSKVEG